MNDLLAVNINNSSYLYADTLIIDQVSNSIIFMSLTGYNASVKEFNRIFKKTSNVYIRGFGYFKTNNKYYNNYTKKQNIDLTHMIIEKKDIKLENNNFIMYIYYKNTKELYKNFYNKLYNNIKTPILEEWSEYIYTKCHNFGYVKFLRVHSIHDAFNCVKITINNQDINNIIIKGLKNKEISINKCNSASHVIQNINGLDDYLNYFGSILAEKIQTSFVPKFIPGKDKYNNRLKTYDDNCYYYNDIVLYNAQKDIIQSNVNNLNINNKSFVIGECGSGKTAIGAGIPYSHSKKDGYNVFVMCPSHLVNKWKREIESLVPNSEAYIIKTIDELIHLEYKIKDKNKKTNLYIIISKETAKLNYDMRPCAIWSKSKKAFVCSECGQVLTKKITIKEGRNKSRIDVPLQERDFVKQYSYNMTCTNETVIWDKKNKTQEVVTCGSKLWTPVINDEDLEWIKLGSEGWINANHLDSLYDTLIEKSEQLTRKDSKFLKKVVEKKIEKDNNKLIKITRAPRKYSLSKYIRKYYKPFVDYAIFDEVHLLKGGKTAQGQAFGDLASVAKKSICLTGTLLNGYADGIFYILYRTVPQLMIEEGFEYDEVDEFMRTFGVIKNTSKISIETSNDGNVSISEKKLPGISPLVFTKFLLEHASFLSLSDMSEGLPKYEEIPIEVNMDTDLRNAYNNLEDSCKSIIGWNGSGGLKVLGSIIQLLSVFPDMPYDNLPIIHPDTNEALIAPPVLNNTIRNKEQALVDLVLPKIENKEKVLIYYQWTNKSDTASKIKKIFEERDIKVAILESKIAPDKREEWIKEQVENGIDILLCNPTLVETGLDLLDFTSIIFYQIGYNIFTLRQASRRSWRLSQDKDIKVYFLYYKDTVQEQALSLMASKLQASMAIEGKFSEEGLRAMSNNEDMLTQIANSVVNGIKNKVELSNFSLENNINKKTFKQIRRPKIFIDCVLKRRNDILKRERQSTTETLLDKITDSKSCIMNLF